MRKQLWFTRPVTNVLWFALALLSGTWLAFYVHALWPFAVEAIKQREPASLYDPWFQIARDVDFETRAKSEWRLDPFVFADAPTGTLEVCFDMPCWPISLGSAFIVVLFCYSFVCAGTRKVRSPAL